MEQDYAWGVALNNDSDFNDIKRDFFSWADAESIKLR